MTHLTDGGTGSAPPSPAPVARARPGPRTPPPPPQRLRDAVVRRACWFQLPGRQWLSVRAARHMTVATLREWLLPEETLSAAELVVSELTTDALRHSESRSLCCCVATTRDARVHVEVHEDHPAAAAPGRSARPAGHERGRGLLLVQRLADAWGAEESDYTVGTAVWATLSGLCPAPAAAPGA